MEYQLGFPISATFLFRETKKLFCVLYIVQCTTMVDTNDDFVAKYENNKIKINLAKFCGI
jgi:hypothetical protein